MGCGCCWDIINVAADGSGGGDDDDNDDDNNNDDGDYDDDLDTDDDDDEDDDDYIRYQSLVVRSCRPINYHLPKTASAHDKLR